MKVSLRAQVCLASLIGCIESTEIAFATINPNFSLIPPVRAHDDPKQSGLVVSMRLALVLRVLLAGYVSQVAETVVGAIAIDVVDLIRPLSMNIKPGKPVRLIKATCNYYLPVSIAIY